MPTAAEVDILAVLWRLGRATVREVHDTLRKACGYNTTLKQTQLMTEKALLARSQRFRAHVYESAVPQARMQRRIAGHLLGFAHRRGTDGYPPHDRYHREEEARRPMTQQPVRKATTSKYPRSSAFISGL